VPSGPVQFNVGGSGKYFAATIDSDGDLVQYRFDWDAAGVHSYSSWTGLVASGVSGNRSCLWSVAGTYVVKAQARDEHGVVSGWSDGLTVVVSSNSPPVTPSIPSGPTHMTIGIYAKYFTTTTDPEGNLVQYRFDWDASGSHDYSSWTNLMTSGQTGNRLSFWNVPGTYVVKAQARDQYGLLSSWSNGLIVVVNS
jgi:hypothetical protein